MSKHLSLGKIEFCVYNEDIIFYLSKRLVWIGTIQSGGIRLNKLFFIAVSVILCVAILLVGYGAFLNYESEQIINVQMANRVLRLDGSQVKERTILPVWERENLRLSAANMTDAISRLDGNIEEVYVNLNDTVKKGQPICRIVNEEIPLKIAQIDVNIAKAEAALVRYEHSYGRYERLVEAGAISQEQYDEALSNYKTASAEVKQLKMERQQYELQQDRLIITAPLDGEVLMLYKTPGSFITSGTSVALIGDFSSLQFTEVVNDADLIRLKPLNAPGELQFSKSDMDKIYATRYKEGNQGAGQKFMAQIVSVEPPPEIEAQMRTVQWKVDNRSGLLEPKRYQDVKIFASQERKGLTIPKSALIENEDDMVYVWKADAKKLELRSITTGSTDGKYVEVFSGLAADEIVIVSGKEGLNETVTVEVEVREDDVTDEK